jgi:hypothetical protein
VGQHYLRRMLVLFQFELHMSVAAAAGIPGALFLGVQGLIGWGAVTLATILLALSAALLFSMARSSAGVLADIRQHLVLGVGEPPFDVQANPRPRSTEPGGE